MSNDNYIKFEIDGADVEAIGEAKDDATLSVIRGRMVIVADGKELTQSIGDNYIINMAVNLSEKMENIAKGDEQRLECNDDSYELVFKKEDKNVNCGVFDQCKDEFEFKDVKIPEEEFFSSLLVEYHKIISYFTQNAKAKEKLMTYSLIENRIRRAEKTLVDKEILTREKIDELKAEVEQEKLQRKQKGIKKKQSSNMLDLLGF